MARRRRDDVTGEEVDESSEAQAASEPEPERQTSIPKPGDTVAYRERVPGGGIVTRAAHVISATGDGLADLHVLTIVPPTNMQRRPQPCRLASRVPFSSGPRENTWGALE